ncbi:MAG TPA: 50S ribosomal protein L6 [Candidatus Nanoarchaeia archaeon]|nr:50S ribosomal protein L6 [Candidatus Nanoarchaeia archaeon]
MGKKKPKQIVDEIALADGVSAAYDGASVRLKGPKGEASKDIRATNVSISIEGKRVILSGKGVSKKEKKAVYSIAAHIKNLLKGVTEGHRYRLKICSGHFPMNVSVTKNEVVIKNFLGEKFPRTLKIKPNVSVKLDGQEMIVEGPSKELCGQVSADIEKLTSVRNRDLRIFQDGIYITDKDGKLIK